MRGQFGDGLSELLELLPRGGIFSKLLLSTSHFVFGRFSDRDIGAPKLAG